VITETNAKGHIISYEYDDAGNLLKKEVQRDANSPKQVLETYNYDYIGRLTSKTDGNQNTIYFEYNGFNKLKKEIHPGDESIPANVILYQYDELGNLRLMENSLGTQDIYTYDNLGRQTSHTRQEHDGSGMITTSVKYDPNGNLRFEIDGNGNTTEKTYDAMNRLRTTKITVSGILQTTTYSYDKNGNLTRETDWRNNSHTYVYDPLNRLIEKRDPYGKVIVRLEYNNNHAQVKSCDALGNLTRYEYDRNNRLIKTIDPENNETTQAYDHLGNVSTHTDGRGNITYYYYDEMNRLEKVVNAKGEVTEYTYDPNGNMLTQKDGNGHITAYEYNCANLVVKRIDHGGRIVTPGNYTYDLAKVESYTYNADGSLATRTDRNGENTIYTYDCHDRLVRETVTGSSISYTYDNNGNQLTVTDTTGTTARTYDELNRVTSKTVTNIGTVYHEYDIIDGVETGETAERTIDPKGNITTKIYDRAGRLKVVRDGDLSSAQRTIYEYYDNGSRASVTYPTGIREEYTYYPDNTLRTLTNKYSDGTVMDVYTYTYDNANNQVSKHEVINGVDKGTTYYTYDVLNRLQKVTEPTGRVTSYTYDMAGNRLTETITSSGETIKNTYSYNEQNRLEEILTKVNNVVTELTSYTYDNNGNQLETIITEYVDGTPQEPETTVTNIYDKRNQLIQTITSDGTTVINGYNGEGLRVSKTVNGQTTYYLYEYDKVVLEVNNSGAQKARNLYGTNLLMRTVDNETYYYIYNGHADVTALIDPDGSIAATYYYDAFGNILEQTGDVDNNITYAGYQYDFETGLYYLNARMYDPKIARFLQEDTYRGNPNDPLSLNLYTYCNNNPLVYYDPTGHWPEWLDKGIEYFKSGFNTLFLKSEEERQEDLNLIYDHGGNDTVTKVITGIGNGLAELGDLWKDSAAQMEENNRKVLKPFVTDTLGIEEGSGAYKVIRYMGLKAESLCIYGINMLKGTVQFGNTIGETIGNAALYNIYDDIDYKIKYLENKETLKSIPGSFVDGTINNVKTLIDPQRHMTSF
jgi:RHS repeat-associated protein